MPELVKRKCHNPDAVLDEQDLKDIAEAEEDIRQGRVYTTKELREKLGIRWVILFTGQNGPVKI